MRSIVTLVLLASFGVSAFAQDTITNAGFERWGNTVPAGDTYTEPTTWYSNQSGSSVAALGPETCFQDGTAPHSGSYCVKVETESYLGIETVNGNVTTGVVNAPNTTKSNGYIGTINYSTATDIRRMHFTARPDSIVGWYQYTPAATTERGKLRAILHVGNYFDPETPTTYHPNPIDSQVASALFLTDTPGTTVSTWTRFSVPFTYTSGAYASDSIPDYIMVNVTSSADQNTSINGSILLLDDLQVVYAPPANLAVTGITTTSAVLNWTEPGVSSKGSEYIVTTTAGAPVGSGTLTTGLTYTATGLTPATTYYASVRDSCLSGAFSNWVTVPFTTLGATAVKNVNSNEFSITAYPNPVGDELTINITGASTLGQVQLMDISGRLISTIVVNSATRLSMNGLSAGIYLIRYIDAEHRQTIKINKQ